MGEKNSNDLLTFGGHLEVLRRMLFRILAVMLLFTVVVFCFKEPVWRLLLAPGEWDFVTYRGMEKLMHLIGWRDFCFDPYHVDLIATTLSSQFMIHIKTSIYIGLLCASPYILYELFRFVLPALQETEKRYSVQIVITVYALFVLGVLMSYFLLFPISFRFLGTYSVASQIHSTITIDSYISTFVTLTFLMGVVFQLPVIAFVLGKIDIIDSAFLARYRKHSFLAVMVVAAVITPGQDILTLMLVTIPLYLLYEVSIRVLRHSERAG